jgi:hypothetical protein
MAWDLALVYLHPLVALGFLDRELGRLRPIWQRAYRRVLLLLPLCLGVMVWQLANAGNLPGEDVLSWRITQHAGAGVLVGISTHLLVAVHVFLESLHYAVWLLAIPLVTFNAAPWQVDQIPLARRGLPWKQLITGVLIVGGTVTLAFWGAFLTDYAATRDIYFTVAMLHVLAEVPFLLRLI